MRLFAGAIGKTAEKMQAEKDARTQRIFDEILDDAKNVGTDVVIDFTATPDTEWGPLILRVADLLYQGVIAEDPYRDLLKTGKITVRCEGGFENRILEEGYYVNRVFKPANRVANREMRGEPILQWAYEQECKQLRRIEEICDDIILDDDVVDAIRTMRDKFEGDLEENRAKWDVAAQAKIAKNAAEFELLNINYGEMDAQKRTIMLDGILSSGKTQETRDGFWKTTRIMVENLFCLIRYALPNVEGKEAKRNLRLPAGEAVKLALQILDLTNSPKKHNVMDLFIETYNGREGKYMLVKQEKPKQEPDNEDDGNKNKGGKGNPNPKPNPNPNPNPKPDPKSAPQPEPTPAADGDDVAIDLPSEPVVKKLLKLKISQIIQNIEKKGYAAPPELRMRQEQDDRLSDLEVVRILRMANLFDYGVIDLKKLENAQQKRAEKYGDSHYPASLDEAYEMGYHN